MVKVQAQHNYYVYFVTNKAKTVLYVGMTNNLKDRLYYHNNPEPYSKSFTHKYRFKYLVYYEHFFDVEDAIAREKQLKRWRREKKDKLIKSFNPTLKFLNDAV
ncbi:MAG: GIY-YIG nuclease family protein [Winogradskyella sp.]|uniref:GIY-YIG nuclease family protein n=1 Tax=Winogradskyella sp. TaxID=1883156 RepID=UPI0018347F3D|nr:GIY-YIG nuclease family protein [Winogradskyella sp.]MBT8244982.1 GIY-YIG nuclease family protein [Winogradskyella sp.]NNK22176.1 GIY-YIG nuclease family protein [Winogradskyella sp.]